MILVSIPMQRCARLAVPSCIGHQDIDFASRKRATGLQQAPLPVSPCRRIKGGPDPPVSQVVDGDTTCVADHFAQTWDATRMKLPPMMSRTAALGSHASVVVGRPEAGRRERGRLFRCRRGIGAGANIYHSSAGRAQASCREDRSRGRFQRARDRPTAHVVDVGHEAFGPSRVRRRERIRLR